MDSKPENDTDTLERERQRQTDRHTDRERERDREKETILARKQSYDGVKTLTKRRMCPCVLHRLGVGLHGHRPRELGDGSQDGGTVVSERGSLETV